VLILSAVSAFCNIGTMAQNSVVFTFAHIVFTHITPLLTPTAFSEFQDGHQTFSPDRHNLTHYTHSMMVQPDIQQQINKRKSPGAYRGQEKKEKKMNTEMSLRVMYAIDPSGRSMEGCTNGRASLWTCAPITGSPRSSRASGLGFGVFSFSLSFLFS